MPCYQRSSVTLSHGVKETGLILDRIHCATVHAIYCCTKMSPRCSSLSLRSGLHALELLVFVICVVLVELASSHHEAGQYEGLWLQFALHHVSVQVLAAALATHLY